MRKTKICSRGHDKDVVGRDSTGWCLECKRIRGKEYHETYDLTNLLKIQFCPHGHDTFIVGRTKKSGLCKECGKKRNLKVYYEHADDIIQKNSIWARNNPEKVKKIKDNWVRLNPMKVKNSKLLQRNGITLEYYNQLFEKQNGKCAICEEHRSKFIKAFAVDHDHACCPGKKSCGKCIRGLLCTGCNTRLGIIENPIFMTNALKYLKRKLI